MFLAALVVGLLAAYYLGIRAGVMAAGAAAVLFFVAAVVPGAWLPIYGAVALAVGGLCLIGPRRRRPTTSLRALGWVRGEAARRLRKLF